MYHIEIAAAECTGCGRCVESCPTTLLAPDPVLAMRDGKAVALSAQYCILCGHCIAACPHDAIRHSELPVEQFPRLVEADLPSLESVKAMLRARRSGRVLHDRPVPRALVELLLDIARWAPSGENAQTVAWEVLDDPAKRAALSARVAATLAETARLLSHPATRALTTLMVGPARVRAAMPWLPLMAQVGDSARSGRDPIFYGAPVVLIAHTPRGSAVGHDDAAYQAYNVMLAAPRLGLETCQIGFVTIAAQIRPMPHELSLPPGREAQVVLTLGYPRYTARRLVPRRAPVISWN